MESIASTNDTGSDGATKLSVEDSKELGGKALKVVYAPGDSFGDRQARVRNWKSFVALQFPVFNPNKEDVHIALTVKRSRMSASSSLSSSSAAISSGSSAMPQSGQLPGPSCTTSGCIGHV